MNTKPHNLIRRLHLRLATEWSVRRARATTLERCRRLPFRKLLVLCYGNIYRSPLVAACLGRELSGDDALAIRTAGFHPTGGRRVREEFIGTVLHLTGLDLSEHRSSVIQLADIHWADSIIIMDRHNWHALARLDINGLDKVIWLGAFLRLGPIEIEDPYGLREFDLPRVIGLLVAASQAMAAEIRMRRKFIAPAQGVVPKVNGD